MSDPCTKVNAFFDGELAAEEAEAFRAHLGACEDCARSMAELAELEGIVSAHRAEVREQIRIVQPAPAPVVVPMASHRRWKILVPAAASLVAAAAAAWLVLGKHAAPPVAEAPLALLDAPSRSLEPRLAYGPADRYRPYDVQRSADGPRGEHVSLEALAQLEKKKDYTGLAAGFLLSGDRSRAREALDHEGKSVEADVERAALAYEQGKLEDALALLDPIVEKDPKNAAAQWNMGLVLRDMQLDLPAAESFEKVAALGEPGWSDEANARAKALHEVWLNRINPWRATKKAGVALVTTGALPDPELVRRYPSYVTRFLYHAMRAAPTRDDVMALLPLATTLDADAPDGFRARAVKRMAAGNFARRGPLAREYRELFPKWIKFQFDDDEIEAYLAKLRTAGEDELAFGVIDATARGAREWKTVGATARSTNDPWLDTIAQGARASSEMMQADFATAETALRSAIQTCDARHFDYLCAKLEAQLLDVFIILERSADASAIAQAGLRRSRTQALDTGYALDLAAADAARQRGAEPLMRAYLRDALLREPEDCSGKRRAHEALADTRLDALDGEGARREIELSPLCGNTIRPERAAILAALPSFGVTMPELASLPKEIAASRASWPPGFADFIDAIVAGFALEADPASARKKLDDAVAASSKLPPGDVTGKKIRAWAHLIVALDAARRGDGDEALREMVADAGGDAVPPCSLAVGLVYQRSFAVTRDDRGGTFAWFNPHRSSPEIDPAELVPSQVRARLATCSTVKVFAPAPVSGTASLLADDVAWSYSIAPAVTAPFAGVPRRLLVSDVDPPASLGLPKLGPWTGKPDPGGTTVWLRGASATPGNVLSAMERATEVELHAHGLVDLAVSDASLVVLSPDEKGKYALTARDIRGAHLSGHPIVVLAACEGGHVAPFEREPWSLPLALMNAGARAVIASPASVDDAQAGPFFEAVLERIRAGEDPARALRDERVARLAGGAGAWVRQVLVFD